MAIEELRIQIPKLPKPCPNQVLKDLAGLTKHRMKLNEDFVKSSKATEAKVQELKDEEVQRRQAEQKELEEAAAEYEERKAAILKQHAIHAADTKSRLKANEG